MKKDDYQPFGEEWKNELMKLPKIQIISFYRSACLAINERKLFTETVDSIYHSHLDHMFEEAETMEEAFQYGIYITKKRFGISEGL